MSVPHPVPARFVLEGPSAGLLMLTWAECLHVTLEDVRDVLGDLQRRPGAAPAVLVELTRMVHLSRQALLLLARLTGVSAVAAVGDSPVDEVLVVYFRTVHRPSYPIRYFEDRTEALAWLSAKIGPKPSPG